MISFLSIIFFCLVAWYLTGVYRAERELKIFFWPALIIKSLAGIGVGLIYVLYYGEGDTLVFFNDANQLTQLAKSDLTSYLYFLFYSSFPGDGSVELSFGDQRAIFMDKIVSVVSLLSFENYWTIAFYLTIVSFLASWYLVKAVHLSFTVSTAGSVVAFLFFPSITFWTSGLIKETISMASLYFLTGLLVKSWNRHRLSVIELIVALIAAWLLWKLKYYFAGIFFAVAGATFIYRIVSLRSKLLTTWPWNYVLWGFTLTLLIICVTFLHPNFGSQKLLTVMVANYEAFIHFSEPEGVVHFYDLSPNFTSILVNSPKALFTGLYRPLFFDANNILGLCLSIENLILMVLSIIALPYLGKAFTSNVSILLCAILLYVILLAIFITLSTPNLGTLARYRVGYLPFFVFLILLAPPIKFRLQRLFNICIRRS